MRRALVGLVMSTLVLTGCSSEPQPPVNAAYLAACEWTAHPATSQYMDVDFLCLDGSGEVPQGLPAPSIVNVWGSWCPPCRDEIPYFVRLHDEYDVDIVGVDVDEPSVVAGQRFALKSGMQWANVLDTSGSSTAIFGTGVPVTWFINSSGEVAYKRIGAIRSYEELVQLAKKHGVL